MITSIATPELILCIIDRYKIDGHATAVPERRNSMDRRIVRRRFRIRTSREPIVAVASVVQSPVRLAEAVGEGTRWGGIRMRLGVTDHAVGTDVYGLASRDSDILLKISAIGTVQWMRKHYRSNIPSHTSHCCIPTPSDLRAGTETAAPEVKDNRTQHGSH